MGGESAGSRGTGGLSAAPASDAALWAAIQCMKAMRRRNGMSSVTGGNGALREPAAVPVTLENSAGRDSANTAVKMERMEELQAENTRLQALICYLLHINEELRQKNTNNQQASATNAA